MKGFFFFHQLAISFCSKTLLCPCLKNLLIHISSYWVAWTRPSCMCIEQLRLIRQSLNGLNDHHVGDQNDLLKPWLWPKWTLKTMVMSFEWQLTNNGIAFLLIFNCRLIIHPLHFFGGEFTLNLSCLVVHAFVHPFLACPWRSDDFIYRKEIMFLMNFKLPWNTSGIFGFFF